MAQQRRGGGNAPRQQERPPADGEQQTQNQKLSETVKASQKQAELFGSMRARRAEIEAVLPIDVPYDKFEAVLNMAIRREPRLLQCYGPSLIRAAIQSAYDGLLPDGKEAVILYSNNKVPGTDQKRMEARYQSMVYGVRKKIVESGAAVFIDATMRFANEPFRLVRGLHEDLHHEPELDPEKRGDPVGCYAVAELPGGRRVFDYMPMAEIMAAKEVSKNHDIWNGPFKYEMWKKTPIRRLAKALPTPSGRAFRDAEAMIDYEDVRHGSAPALAPPRPERRDFRPAIEHQQSLGEDLGLDAFRDAREEEEVRVTATKPKDEPAKKQQAAAVDQDQRPGPDGAEKKAASDEGKKIDALPLPTTKEGFDQWAVALIEKIRAVPGPAALERLETEHQAAFDAAPQPVRDQVADALSDRRSDFIGGEPSDGAGTSQGSLLPDGD